MEAIPVEFSKILKRVRLLADGPIKYEDVLNRKFKNDIADFKSLELNPLWGAVGKSLYPEIKSAIEEIKLNRENIFSKIVDHLHYTIVKDVTELERIEGIQPDLDVQEVTVDDKLRKEWFRKIEIEIGEYEKLILNASTASLLISRTGSLNLKSGVSNDQLSILFYLNISQKFGNEEFIDRNQSGTKEEFISIFKSKDLTQLKSNFRFRFACDNMYVAFIFHWLNEKKIISGSWKAIELSKSFFSKTAGPEDPINSGTLRNALSSKVSRSKINKLILTPSHLSLNDLDEQSEPEEVLQYLHAELSDCFKTSNK